MSRTIARRLPGSVAPLSAASLLAMATLNISLACPVRAAKQSGERGDTAVIPQRARPSWVRAGRQGLPAGRTGKAVASEAPANGLARVGLGRHEDPLDQTLPSLDRLGKPVGVQISMPTPMIMNGICAG
jgi:hypothetical protein